MSETSRFPFTHEALRAATTVHRAAKRMARFHDVDAAGTVFFPRYFEYASELAIEHLLHRGVDVPGVLRAGSWAAPLVHVEADYAAPLRFGDRFEIQLVALYAGRSSYGFGLRLLRDDDTRALVATVAVMHVCIDAKTFRPMALPADLRAALTD